MSNQNRAPSESGFLGIKRADQADPAKVLRAIKQAGRFSCFGASENDIIARTVTNLFRKKLARIQPDGTRREYGVCLEDAGGEYPITKVRVTADGERLLADEPEQPAKDKP